MLKNVLKLLKEDMQKYSHTYTCNCIPLLLHHFFKIMIIFKLFATTDEILFILHVSKGILITIHNFEKVYLQ